MGMFETNTEKKYLLTIVDRLTGWLEAIAVINPGEEDCARAILTHWVPNFGVPKEIGCDRGIQFTANLWN